MHVIHNAIISYITKALSRICNKPIKHLELYLLWYKSFIQSHPEKRIYEFFCNILEAHFESFVCSETKNKATHSVIANLASTAILFNFFCSTSFKRTTTLISKLIKTEPFHAVIK